MAFTVRVRDQQAIYFMTLTVNRWVDVFSRQQYAATIIESLRHCQQNKGLLIYGYVLMTNHLHLLASCEDGYNMSSFLRDFKKFTAKEIIRQIAGNEVAESRKDWLLWLLQVKDETGKGAIRFWQEDNHAEEIYSRSFFGQKLNYIHQNPVRAGYVQCPEHW